MMTAETLNERLKKLFSADSGKFDDELMMKFAQAIVEEIQQNAIVTTTVVGSVTSGLGAGGVVAGTGTGTIK